MASHWSDSDISVALNLKIQCVNNDYPFETIRNCLKINRELPFGLLFPFFQRVIHCEDRGDDRKAKKGAEEYLKLKLLELRFHDKKISDSEDCRSLNIQDNDEILCICEYTLETIEYDFSKRYSDWQNSEFR